MYGTKFIFGWDSALDPAGSSQRWIGERGRERRKEKERGYRGRGGRERKREGEVGVR